MTTIVVEFGCSQRNDKYLADGTAIDTSNDDDDDADDVGGALGILMRIRVWSMGACASDGDDSRLPTHGEGRKQSTPDAHEHTHVCLLGAYRLHTHTHNEAIQPKT